MTDTAPAFSLPYTVLALRKRKTIEIRHDADADTRAALAAELQLIEIPSLRVEASVTAVGRDQWRVSGTVRAKVVQTCVITLNPVSAIVEEAFDRRFTEDQNAVGSDLDFDPVSEDPPELIDESIDVGVVASEALALGLDPYPRARGATFDGAAAIPPGAEPIRPADLKPFAGLAALKKAMTSEE
ncbi:MAG: YceD family protein [Pikeienuella sp.]